MTTESATFMPIALPGNGPPFREVVTIDQVRSGQPRPGADHEDVLRITIRKYDHQGNLADPVAEDAEAVLYDDDEDLLIAIDDFNDHLVAEALTASYHLTPYRVSPALAEQLLGNGWVRADDYEIRDNSTADGHFATYVDKAEIVGPYTVEITTITPFAD